MVLMQPNTVQNRQDIMNLGISNAKDIYLLEIQNLFYQKHRPNYMPFHPINGTLGENVTNTCGNTCITAY